MTLQKMTSSAYFLLFLSLAALQVNLCSYADACFRDFIGLCDGINKHAVDVMIDSREIYEKNIQIKRLIELHKGLMK